MKRITLSSGYGEAQLIVEMLSAACTNYWSEFERGIEKEQTIIALRVIGHHVTFYRCTINVAYFKQILVGIPIKNKISIHRFPESNHSEICGYDLTDTAEREVVMTALAHLRQNLSSK